MNIISKIDSLIQENNNKIQIIIDFDISKINSETSIIYIELHATFDKNNSAQLWLYQEDCEGDQTSHSYCISNLVDIDDDTKFDKQIINAIRNSNLKNINISVIYNPHDVDYYYKVLNPSNNNKFKWN